MSWPSSSVIAEIDATIRRLSPTLGVVMRGLDGLERDGVVQEARVACAAHWGGIANLEAWIVASACNAANQSRRRETRYAELRFHLDDPSASGHCDAEVGELVGAVRACVARVLTAREQDIIVAVEMNREPIAEYARRTGEAFEACRSRVKRAKRRLEADAEFHGLATVWLGRIRGRRTRARCWGHRPRLQGRCP